MAISFNNADDQMNFDVIPADSVVPVVAVTQPGGAGDDGHLTRSKDANALMLKLEFKVIEGKYKGRKFWEQFVIEGLTDGHAKASKISFSKFRAMLESARGIRPDDKSDAAANGRAITGWGDFNGLCFVCKVDVEAASGAYKAKNRLGMIVTPEKEEWSKLEQLAGKIALPTGSPQPQAAPQAAPAAKKPAWA